jgi:hypothetical protein
MVSNYAVTAAAVWLSLFGAGSITPTLAAGDQHLMPQSLRFERDQIMAPLGELAQHQGPVGTSAQKVIELINPHMEREDVYVFPPLSLLPAVAAGRITPDMVWAIAMADKVKANIGTLHDEHTQIVTALLDLVAAGERENDVNVVGLAHEVTADQIEEVEVLQPATILVGELLRSKLPPH